MNNGWQGKVPQLASRFGNYAKKQTVQTYLTTFLVCTSTGGVMVVASVCCSLEYPIG